ncbi:hypothetical protein CEXT_767941 [Caerostris extrusa]|uniref:Uncharacterized protein n=1 Tax=Caerostris extrusa TaxID=172846 RepID=A0AAV4VBR6_CAEEX|nr:hypothetical protein CEXT_767941 [Caerostris extrusa]
MERSVAKRVAILPPPAGAVRAPPAEARARLKMAANGSELEDPERDGMSREGRATPLQNAFEHPFAQEKAAPPWITNALCVQNRRMLRAGSTER